MERLRKDDRRLLITELGLSGIDDGWSILLMYAPGIMQNVARDEASEDSLVVRLSKGLEILVLLYRKARAMLDNHLLEFGAGIERNGV